MLWSEMTEAELVLHGCGIWSQEIQDNEEVVHYLLKPEHWDDLEPGDQLTAIDGEVKTVREDYQDPESPNYIDNDARFGALAWGVVIRKPIKQRE